MPDDLALTGWDDVIAARLRARLTTVHQSMRELGATAAGRLDERITGTAAGGRTEDVRNEGMPTRLVLRSSWARE